MTARMKSSEFRAIAMAQQQGKQGRGKKKGNKYGAVKEVVDGITFDSKREAKRYGELKNLEQSGLISDLELQPRFALQGPNGPLQADDGRQLFYYADFCYRDGDQVVIEDVKSEATSKNATYRLKRAIVRNMGHNIEEV